MDAAVVSFLAVVIEALESAFLALPYAALLVLTPVAHAAEAGAASAGGGLKSWALMAAVGLLSPLALAWARRKVPAALANWVLGRVRAAMSGNGIEDAEVRELVRDLVLVLVRFAERKLPDSGLGPQRMELILSTVGRVPMAAAWLRKPANREAFVAIVEDAVKRLDDGLKGIGGSK